MGLEDHPTVKWFREKESKGPGAPASEMLEAKALKTLAMSAGAHDMGLVSIDNPNLAGEAQEILELFPRTKALISFVCRLNRENIRSVSRAVADLEFLQGFEKVNRVARKLVSQLSEKGIFAVNHSVGFPMNLAAWPGKIWSVSHKTVAVAAGLGHLGHNRLVIHPRFGNFVLLGTVLIDQAVTVYDQPLDYNPCITCGLCVSVCPVGAIASDGRFNFANCMTHNYRDRLGGFSDWVESIVKSKSVSDYRKRITDSETVSMWQSLSYGICNKSSYCMAVCPAGKDHIEPYLTNRKEYSSQVVKPLQRTEETVYVLPGSDAEAHVSKKFPHKKIKRVGTGLRPASAAGFLDSLDLIFQRERSEGLEATYHFTFTGDEQCTGTVIIRNRTLEVTTGHVGTANIAVTADTRTWLDFLAKEKNLFWALLQRKIRIKGSPVLMKKFAGCFPL